MVEIRDRWPAILVELGVLTNPLVIRVLERLELAAYAAADEVVVVTEGLRADLLRRGVGPDKVHTIRDGVDVGWFAPVAETGSAGERRALRARLGAGPDDCLVLSAGTHGTAQALTAIADAAAILDRSGGASSAGAGPVGPARPPNGRRPAGSRSVSPLSGTAATSGGWSAEWRNSGSAT